MYGAFLPVGHLFKNPNLGNILPDYLLLERGQIQLANKDGCPPLEASVKRPRPSRRSTHDEKSRLRLIKVSSSLFFI